MIVHTALLPSSLWRQASQALGVLPHQSRLRYMRRICPAREHVAAAAATRATAATTQSGTAPARAPIAAASKALRISGSYVLPSRGLPRGVVHFLGGAFVGSAPELMYALLMRLLAEGGYTVVATPYALTFMHAECAHAVQQDFEAAVRELQSTTAGVTLVDSTFPVFGVGHSNGALLHLLGGALGLQRHAGDAFISFNNKEVTAAIPVPLGSLQPLLRAARQMPAVRSATSEQALAWLAALLPSGLLDAATQESLALVLNQLDLVLREVENGASEFDPPPAASRALIAQSYPVQNALLIGFRYLGSHPNGEDSGPTQDDGIDESPELEQLLNGRVQQLTSLLLPGTHVTPCGGSAADTQIGRIFSPADAVKLVLRQLAEQDTRRVAAQLLRWLDAATAIAETQPTPS